MRRDEIEQILLARVSGVQDLDGADVEYLQGLRAAVSAAVDFALLAIELGGDRTPPVPPRLLDQARLAARDAVPLDVVIRRYFSCFLVLANFVAEEEEANGALGDRAVRRMFQSQAGQVDRVIDAVAEAYAAECKRVLPTEQQRRVDRAQRLLDGEPLGLGDFGYELRQWHLGIVAEGTERNVISALAKEVGAVSFSAAPNGALTWGWLGSSRPLRSGLVAELAESLLGSEDRLAIGGPADGVVGWRLTHNEAKAAFSVGTPGTVTLYGRVGLISCILRDETMAASLRRKYIAPLSEERDGGDSLRRTLQAYFSSGRRIGSAAASLQLSRQTVRNRLRAFEEKVRCPLDECGVEVEIALATEQHQLEREPQVLS